MKSIILIGFMGTGKSRVGKELAKKLGWRFLDTDDLIEEKCGMKIKEIFKKFGEKYFRDRESEAARKVGRLKGTVIATGGGIVLREKNIKNLRKNGILICLTSKPEVILKRIGKSNKRPLLAPKREDALFQIRSILKKRKPYYAQADYVINTSNLRVREVVERIQLDVRS